jgi:hypothetical protein
MNVKVFCILLIVFLTWLSSPILSSAAVLKQTTSEFIGASSATATAENPVSIENAKMGTALWELTNPALQHQIEGYASVTSVDRGQAISFYVNTAAPTFNLDIFRMGYYGGAGARLVYSAASLQGRAQPVPCLNPNGVIECNWSVSHTVTVPSVMDPTLLNYWASGVYLARLTADNAARNDSYVIFVVRDDARVAQFVAQLPIATYQAYNYWGGKSLYTGCLNHDAAWACPNSASPATAVSFSRPFTPSSNPAAAYGAGAGEFLTNVQTVQEGYPISSAAFDYNMVRWLEKEEKDVKYITNLDLHENQNVLHGALAFITFGHDEYYSNSMWNSLVAARNAAINLAFFSSNDIYWRVRFQPGYYGRINGIMVCYKFVQDPVTSGDQRTGPFRDLGKPEASLIGGQYGAAPVTGDIHVTNPNHWLYAGSGATGSTLLRGLLGYEVNAIEPGISPSNVVSLAHTSGNGFTSDVSFYIASSSAQVFSTGSMAWAWGLDNYFANGLRQTYASPIAQKITLNVLDALSEKGLEMFVNGASSLFLATDGALTAGQAVQSAMPSGMSKVNKWRVLPSDAGTVRIVSRANGLCLDAYGTMPGAIAGTWECNGAPNQIWTLSDQGNGYVSIRDGRAGLCVASNGSQAGLTLATCSQQGNQLWLRTTSTTSIPPVPTPPTSDIKPNVVITLSDPNNVRVLSLGGTQAGPLTLTPTPARPDYSQWRPTATSDASYFSVVSVANGLCLDAYGTSSGAIVGSWPCSGGDNQSWNFVGLGSSVYTLADRRSGLCITRDAATDVRLAACQSLASQRWLKAEPVIAAPTLATFANAANGYFLGTAANATAPSLVTQAPVSGSFATEWKQTLLEDGYMTLTSTAGYCLDAYGTADGANIGTWDCTLNDNQRWKFVEAAGGRILLIDKRSSKCVGNGEAASAGAVLVLGACSGNTGQLWTRQVK